VVRRLAAIVAADIAGYSRLMRADEEGTLVRLKAVRRELVDPKIAEHRGRIVKTAGDSMLIEFASVVDALHWAIEAQRSMKQRNADMPQDGRIAARIGVHVGDIICEGRDIFGDGVNVAARLERLAEPGGICISQRAKEFAERKLNVDFEDLGEQKLKNIEAPVHAYRVLMDAVAPRAQPALALPDRPSIAVLPFQNLSGDPEQEYFADGMVEEIITALSRVRSFFVIARNSSFAFRGRAMDPLEVGRELGVCYLLTGSVRRASDRVRIAVQLISARTGSHIWSERYEGGIEEIFELQDRITENVVGAIHSSIIVAEIERTKRRRPEKLSAYEYVLQAYPHIWAFDPAANETALSHLTRAIEIEGDYPLALALAAWCRAREVIYLWTSSPETAKSEGLRLAKLAGDMNSDDPMVLTALCAAHSVVGDLEMASALVDKAVALDPNSALAWNRSGWVNAYLDRAEVAIRHFERAIRLSPFDPMKFNCFFGIRNAHFAAHRYEESLAWCRKGMLERPELIWPLRSMAAALALLGRVTEARDAVRRLRETYPDITISKIMAITPHRGDYLARYGEGLRRAGLPE
jgi:adenylate cyclase